MKKMKRKYLIPIIGLGLSIAFMVGGNASFTEPASDSDPLVTLSFVEQRIEQVKFYINNKIDDVMKDINENKEDIEALQTENTNLKAQIEELQTQKSETNTVTESNLEVVEIEAGQKLIGAAGTEIILRGGKGTAITTELGGLSDVTSGVDIKMGQEIPANHLLILPRNDGRGIHATTKAIFMVRGAYIIR